MTGPEEQFIVCGILEGEEFLSAKGRIAAVVTMCAPFLYDEALDYAQTFKDPEERENFRLTALRLMSILGTEEVPVLRSNLFHASGAAGFRTHLGGPEARIENEASTILRFVSRIQATMKPDQRIMFLCVEGLNRSAFGALLAVFNEMKKHGENDVSRTFKKGLIALRRIRPWASLGYGNEMFFNGCFGYGAFEEIQIYRETMRQVSHVVEVAKGHGIKYPEILFLRAATRFSSLPEPVQELLPKPVMANLRRYHIIRDVT